MKKLYIILILLSSSFLSCSRNEPFKPDYEWHEDGNIYKRNSNELYSGKIVDTTETLILDVEIVNGKRNGEFKSYDLDGTLRIVGIMKNNFNDGIWRYYYSNGQIETEGLFFEDKPESTWTFYDFNGTKREEGDFLKGKRAGAWNFYDSLGRLDSIRQF